MVIGAEAHCSVAKCVLIVPAANWLSQPARSCADCWLIASQSGPVSALHPAASSATSGMKSVRRRGVGLGARGDAVLLQEILELAILEHLADDVAAADELALHIELRNGRPVREFLDTVADLGIGEDVDAFELDAQGREDLH